MTVITQPYPDWLKFSWSLHNYVLHLLTSQSHLLILEYWNYNTPYISISLSFWSSFNLKIRSFDQWAHLLVFCVCLAMLVRCCWYWSGIVSSICVVVTVVWLSETLRYSQRERERERVAGKSECFSSEQSAQHSSARPCSADHITSILHILTQHWGNSQHSHSSTAWFAWDILTPNYRSKASRIFSMF